MISSAVLIEKTNECLRDHLSRCIEKGVQPSFKEMFFSGFLYGIGVAKGIDSDDVFRSLDWIGVDVRLPENDDAVWCLCEHDGWYECIRGWYDDGKWNLSETYGSFRKVVAWHRLPDIPEFGTIK